MPYFIFIYFLTFLSLFSQPRETYSVCTWNVENWGITDRFVGGRFEKEAMKSVLSILKRINPDILGVSEILRDPQDRYLKLFQDRLKGESLLYPYSATIQGSDPRIQCAIFSRFPILEQYSHTDLQLEVLHQSKEGTRKSSHQGLLRGLLHLRIQITPDYELQLMQVHLKSKRRDPTLLSTSTEESGDDYVRRQEALLVKNAMNRILIDRPETNLLLMGDLNDTPRSKAVKTLIGTSRDNTATYDLWLQDWLGDWWTHFYFPDKSYSRIDYMIASEGLMRDWIKEKSFIYRSKEGDPESYLSSSASDHRPLLALFRASDKRK